MDARPDSPDPRGAGAAAIVGRTIHFFGGMDETRTIEEQSHWSLDLDDPAATWVEKRRCRIRGITRRPRRSVERFDCVGGQYSQEANQAAQLEVDCYDPATDTWTRVADLPARGRTPATRPSR